MGNQLIFHYCNVATALSILKNREIWMTSIRNMNDVNESVGVYRMFFELLQKYDVNNQLEEVCQFARTPGVIQMYETPLGAYPEYIACFSSNSDLVSQWSAYADGGNGVAIGFDENAIINFVTRSGDSLAYRKILYVSEEDIQQHIPSIHRYLMCHQCETRLEMMDKAMEFIRRIYPLGINYKTVHYMSECESRLVYKYPGKIEPCTDDWEIKERQAYARRDVINTYVPLRFPEDVIKQIVLGPKYQRNYVEIENALEVLGYSKIDIEQSNSGYR